MRIGIFTDAYEPHTSGVTTSIKMLKEALEMMNHEVYIVTANLDGHGFKYDEGKKTIYIPGIKTGIYDTKLTGLYSKRALDIIKSWNLDVIHSQTEFGIGAFSRIVSKKLDLPVVHTYHTLYEDYIHYVTHGLFKKTSKRIVIRFTKYFCQKKCDQVIVPTDKIKDLFVNRYNIKKNIHVIPTGIDVKKFHISADIRKNVKKIKAKYKIKDDDFILGSVCRIASEKSVDRLISAMVPLVEANPKVKLMLVGDGPEFGEMENLVKKLKLEGNVIMTGLVEYSKIPSMYNTFDAVVSFSVTETQGLTIIEGLAASKPTLCINDESFREMLVDGYNGYLFKDEKEFMEDVIKLINNKNLYKKMSENAKNSTYRYSKEVFGADVLKVYHKAIANRK